jgi:hypothetical protein
MAAEMHVLGLKSGRKIDAHARDIAMVCAKSTHIVLPFILAVFGVGVTAQVSKATRKDSALWEIDLKTLGYPTCPSESSSKSLGPPPTTLVFADPLHLVATFVSCGRLYATVFDARNGDVQAKRDWPSGNVTDGVVTAHDGGIVMIAGNRLTLYAITLEPLKDKELDTLSGRPAYSGPFRRFTSPTGLFVLFESFHGKHLEYSWMNADNLEFICSLPGDLFPLGISDTEILGRRRKTPHGEAQLIIQKRDEQAGWVIMLLKHPNYGVLVNQGIFVMGAGYSSMSLFQTDGTLIETIKSPGHDFASRVTPSADGRRFAFTGSSIRNVLEFFSPQEQWEYVQRVLVYDISTRQFIRDVRVRHSTRNQEFPLALSPDGSRLAFFDGNILKVYDVPVTAKRLP